MTKCGHQAMRLLVTSYQRNLTPCLLMISPEFAHGWMKEIKTVSHVSNPGLLVNPRVAGGFLRTYLGVPIRLSEHPLYDAYLLTDGRHLAMKDGDLWEWGYTPDGIMHACRPGVRGLEAY